ncbi:MAG: ATP-dependent Clp protease ATP-binding subunit [Clostridia bacterium]|nr:ATP-dependent Clp protease ATP-binding subunit [Clostridia bacterium]
MTKLENGEKDSRGLCIKCARELGIPVDNMMGGVLDKFGMNAEQLESMEDDITEMLESGGLPSDSDDNEDGGAPAIDFPKLLRESGLFPNANIGGNLSNISGNGGEKLPVEKSAESGEKNREKRKEKGDKKYKFLTTYCRNLTKAAKDGKIDRIIGRDRELARIIQILCRRQKNNPCLIGEPGVGKTAIAEALAIRTADGDLPYKLKGKEIYLVDLTALVAGTQFRGQFESRVLGLLSEVKEKGNAILVIDEVHNIVGAGDSDGSINAANIFKPALSRGEVQIIGATTLNEYRKYIEKDTALERRFQPVTVNEPSIDETADMLRGIKHYYEEFHGIVIPDELIKKTVVLSERYITDRYLPDKAIDLLDEAASSLSLNSACINESYEIRDNLLALKEEREALENQIVTDSGNNEENNYEQIAKIKEKEIKLSERLKELEPLTKNVLMTVEDLAQVIEVWTGVPAQNINQDEFEKIDKIEERLKERIIGQDEAVSAVARAIKRNRAGISYKRKPVSFIFAGPTGVGKTELVKTLAADLFNSPETLIRLDMSEFMEKHSVSRIIGAPPGYVGYDEAGQLTEKIRRRPYSVVLFDEIEKAHPDVLNVLLQILDDGRITDARGKTVNFENTIIVMTTNAGSDKGSAAGFFTDSRSVSESKTQKALEGFLRPEFINRVDEIITFRSLDRNDFIGIARIMLGELKTAMSEKDISLEYTDGAVEYIAEKSFSEKFGARNMRRFIQRELEDKLAELIISNYKHGISGATVSCEDSDNGKTLKIECIGNKSKRRTNR